MPQFAPYDYSPFAGLGNALEGAAEGAIHGQNLANKFSHDQMLNALRAFQMQNAMQPKLVHAGPGLMARTHPDGRVEFIQGPEAAPKPMTPLQEKQMGYYDALTEQARQKSQAEPKPLSMDQIKGSVYERFIRARASGDEAGAAAALEELRASEKPPQERPERAPHIHYERDDKGNVTQLVTKTDAQGNTTTQKVPQGAIGGTRPAATDVAQLTPDAIESAARRYGETGELPALGSRGGQTRAAILNRHAQLVQQGQIAPNLVQNRAAYMANKAELSQLLAQRGKILAFEKTAEMNLDLAEKLSAAVPRTGIPALNKWILSGQQQWGGDPQVAAFAAAVKTAANEYAKVTSSATGGGVTSDAARHEAAELFNTAMTQDQVRAAVRTLRQDMKNRIVGYDQQVEMIRKNLGTSGGLAPTESQIKGESASPGKTLSRSDARYKKARAAGFTDAQIEAKGFKVTD